MSNRISYSPLHMINLTVVLAFPMIAQMHGSHNRATEKQRSNLLKTIVNTLTQIMYTTNVSNIMTYLNSYSG